MVKIILKPSLKDLLCSFVSICSAYVGHTSLNSIITREKKKIPDERYEKKMRGSSINASNICYIINIYQ